VVLVLECTLKSILDPCAKRLTIGRVVDVDSCLPKHHTTEVGVSFVLVDQIIGILRINVVVFVCRQPIRPSWQSKVDLAIWVLLRICPYPVGPLSVGEGARGAVLLVLNSFGSGDFPCVVKLHENEVE
jgi:hypothetical protein